MSKFTQYHYEPNFVAGKRASYTCKQCGKQSKHMLACSECGKPQIQADDAKHGFDCPVCHALYTHLASIQAEQALERP